MSSTPELITAYVTEGKIEGYRIVAFGEDKDGAKQATADTDKFTVTPRSRRQQNERLTTADQLPRPGAFLP